MDYLTRKLPYSDGPRSVTLPSGEIFPIRSHQIVIWVSLTTIDSCPLAAGTRRLPALLDTGLGHNFLISAEHLASWALVDQAALQGRGKIELNGVAVPLRLANVWVHRNRDEELDAIDGSPPYCLELDDGIAVSPLGSNYPRIPILGMRAARLNKLVLRIDASKLRISIATR